MDMRKIKAQLWFADDRLRQQELEDRHSRVEYELRRLMAIPGLCFDFFYCRENRGSQLFISSDSVLVVIFWYLHAVVCRHLLSVGVVVCNAAGMRASWPQGAWERCRRLGLLAAGCVDGQRAGGRARGRSGGRHCMAGQYSYVPL